ncbi:hypothetical protein HanIR_Chr01g0026931 [Helianthus annuus]|nr:hypothetical protein HanIR_Chr01g0026931 [Helianthus annuus]
MYLSSILLLTMILTKREEENVKNGVDEQCVDVAIYNDGNPTRINHTLCTHLGKGPL